MRPPGRINQGGTAGFPVPQTGFPREARMGDQKTAVFCFPEFLAGDKGQNLPWI